MTAPVRIKLCGGLVVERDGVVLVDRALGSRKGRLLLQLLAVHRGRLVATERIVDVLWPADQPRDAGANVATLVSRLRSVLGDGVVAGSRSAYGLLPGGAWITDVDAAKQLVREATDRHRIGESALAFVAATGALELIGGHVGIDELPQEDWVVSLRDEVRGLLRDARHLATISATATGDHQAAGSTAEAAVATDPLDEQATRDLMAALAADGRSASALSVYVDLQRTLRRELGIDPHRDTRELHLAILRGEPLPTTAPARAAPRSEGQLLGRADEVAAMSGAWTAAVSGVPSLVVVLGEAGIGKSRLLAETVALARSTGGLVLAARCHASERSLFLQPVVEALRPELTALRAASLSDLAGSHADALVTLLPQLAAAMPHAERHRVRAREPEAERRLVYEATAQVLSRLSREAPVLLVLDDAHDAGLATVDLLDYLVRHLGAARVLLVAAARSEEGQALLDRTGEHRRLVTLGPLPVSAVTAMAVAAGHAEQAAALAARTKGHPFSVVEMLRALAAGESGIPPSLAEAVLRRVQRAGPDAEPTMQAAAVLGTQFDPARLAGLLGISELEAVRRCETLVAARLMTQGGLGYAFGNDLVQEVVYDALPPAARHLHHRRAADLLADEPEAMARHAEAVDDWERAARAWLLAGEQATLRWAAGDAIVLLDRSLTAAARAGTQDLTARALLARAAARESLADYRPALVDLDQALAATQTTGDRRLEMAVLRARGGDVPVALHHPAQQWGAFVETGLRIATELGDRVAVADFSARLAVLHCSALRFDQASSYAQRAVAAGRASHDDRALAGGLDGLKTVHAYLGDVAALRVVVEELDPLLRRIGNTWLLQWCVFESAFISAAAGDFVAARGRIDAAIELNRRVGFAAYASLFTAYRGWLARLAGDLETALDDGYLAINQAQAVEHPWWLATSAGLHAATLLAAGRREEAADVADRGWRSVPDHGAEAYVLLGLAPLAEATGDPDRIDEAQAMLDAVVAPPGHAWLLGSDAYLCLARAHRARGDTDLCRAAADPLLRATGPHHWAAIHRAARAALLA